MTIQRKILSAVSMSSFVPGVVFAQERPYDWGWGMHPMMWGTWGFGMMLMMILFWGLLIVAVVMGIRWLSRESQQRRSDSALEILRQRYARGEINKEEFEAKKRDLGSLKPLTVGRRSYGN